ncbi:hypothetical protein SELMODRAFT_404615 [Selaginella moellendorffii]|uniref:F-box domain-containing protein n=1 Tax=Selaginella moellendorffii TaxID=88036 RepID=D8QVW2_SELML|nr:hypothetical protein SELMODRAFT_404615 [Selaginella moellendorffii]
MAKRKWDGMTKTRRKRMNPSIWSRLPRDIQHQLITHLPIPTLCRFCSLSKDWHAAILQQQSRQQWYITFANSEVFNPMIQNRHELLPRLIGNVIFTAIQSVPCGSEGISYIVVAVTTSGTAGNLRMHLYDSRVAAWISTTDFPVPDNGELFCRGNRNYNNKNMLLQGDHLYFFTVSPGNVTRLKLFNVWNPKATLRTVATWTSLPLGFDAAGYARTGFVEKDMSLISCGGRIVLGILEPRDDNRNLGSRRFGFVYLDKESCSWQVMASLSLDSVFSPGMIKNSEYTTMIAVGNKNSSEVALLFQEKWGCILNLASGRCCFKALIEHWSRNMHREENQHRMSCCHRIRRSLVKVITGQGILGLTRSAAQGAPCTFCLRASPPARQRLNNQTLTYEIAVHVGTGSSPPAPIDGSNSPVNSSSQRKVKDPVKDLVNVRNV